MEYGQENLAIEKLLRFARENDCSDIHITPNLPPVFRRLGQLRIGPFQSGEKENRALILSLLDERQKEELKRKKDVDFGFQDQNGLRQRANVYHQKGQLCAAIRILRNEIPTLRELSLPPAVEQLAQELRGLVLVTGPTGSGKSTTLAAMIDYINENRRAHIITIEDPIEYVHSHKKCVVHQREVQEDVESFSRALRAAMREDPDVILVGEMRDYETISAAVTAAETGHLVLSTLHTTGAAQTLDRIVDAYPPHSQGQLRSQLAGVLRGIISQTLVPKADQSGRVAATEILVGTDAVGNLIREGKYHQLASVMQSGGALNMHTLSGNLARLIKKGIVTRETAMEHAVNKRELTDYLGI